MKTTLTIISVLATLAVAAPDGLAQEGDDDDLFGDDNGEGDFVDDSTDTTDTTDTTGDTTADTSAAAATGAMAHPLGIGFSTTVGGLQSFSTGALEAEYWIGEKLAINALARLGFFSPDQDGADTNLLLQVGGGALLVVKNRGAASLMVGGRFLLGFTSGDDGTTSIALEAPLRLQMRLAPRLSAHVEGGVALGIGGQEALTLTPAQDFTLLIGSRNVFGAAGLTAYF